MVSTFQILVGFSLIFISLSDPDPNIIFPLVSTSLGQIRGQALQSRSGRWYYGFQGIPYTKPPARFEPADPPEEWEGILDGRVAGSACPHRNGSMGFVGSEDCLFINVYFPHYDRCQNELTPSGLLPVIVYIHGGSYTTGAASNYGLNYYLDECVILALPNYRQGALGFLTTEDGLIPGNLGLKDQVLAFKWIQNHIENFRGDPNLVTITGSSSGASGISHHLTSPASAGLFHRAITLSGSVASPWSILENPGAEARNLGRVLNCDVQTTATLKSCLLNAQVEDIVANQVSSPFIPTPFTPVIELSSTVNPFQTEHPMRRLVNGDFNKVPLIAGFLENEQLLDDPLAIDMMNNMWLEAVPIFFMFDQLNLTADEMNRISMEIRDFYFGNEIVGPNTRQNLTDMLSDRFFIQGVFDTVQYHSKFADVYPYIMTYNGGNCKAWGNHGYEIPYISHGDDGQYFFGWSEFNYGTDQYEFSQRLIGYWTNFARFGEPKPKESTDWFPVTGTANALWHRLDLTESNIPNILADRRNLWTSLGLYEAEWNFTPN